MSDCLFSIIVPVYNVEGYLSACLESILHQTISNYEVILVDDGSTDSSGKLCDSVAEKERRVYVIHQHNKGLSAARNTGILAAIGEYLLFVDSDDYITEDALEQFYHVIKKNNYPDIVAAYANKLSSTGEIEEKFPQRNLGSTVLPGGVFFETALKRKAIVACAPFNVYRRDLIVTNNLFYKEGISHEDEWWTPQVFFKAKSAVDAEFTFYYHRYRTGSITHSYEARTKNALDILSTCLELEKTFDLLYPNEARWTKSHLAEIYMSAVFSGNLCKQFSSKIDRFFPIRNAASKKCIVKAMLFAISPRLYCFLDQIEKGRTKR